jgi:hypothetical protein
MPATCSTSTSPGSFSTPQSSIAFLASGDGADAETGSIEASTVRTVDGGGLVAGGGALAAAGVTPAGDGDGMAEGVGLALTVQAATSTASAPARSERLISPS